MTRTTRNWYRWAYCHECSSEWWNAGYPNPPKLKGGWCSKHNRVPPWRKQHEKRVRTRRRNKYKAEHCCAKHNIYWVNDLKELWRDIKRNELYGIDDTKS